MAVFKRARNGLNNNFVVNLKSHHTQCELNFHLCMALFPHCRTEQSQWQFNIAALTPPYAKHRVLIQRLDLAPYTTTLQITQSQRAKSYITTPKLTVRLYHDVEMAEVVAWNNHRHWHPVYSYPNRQMYQRDEKLALNRFLGEWLVHCRKLGLCASGFVNPLP